MIKKYDTQLLMAIILSIFKLLLSTALIQILARFIPFTWLSIMLFTIVSLTFIMGWLRVFRMANITSPVVPSYCIIFGFSIMTLCVFLSMTGLFATFLLSIFNVANILTSLCLIMFGLALVGLKSDLGYLPRITGIMYIISGAAMLYGASKGSPDLAIGISPQTIAALLEVIIFLKVLMKFSSGNSTPN